MSEENVEQVAQPETPAEVASGGSGNDFLQMIPEELRQDPSLTPIKDVENLARSFVNAQKLIGADKIPLPVNPTEEDLDRIYNKLGRPETPKGYEVEVDGNVITEEVATNFSDIAHKLRLNPTQAKGILDYYKSNVDQTGELMAQQAEQEKQQSETALRSEWGLAYDQKVESASQAAKEFAGEDVFNLQLADGTTLGNHPEFVKAFAKIAEFRQNVTSEDTVAEMSQVNVMTPAKAQAEIDAIMNDKSHAYWDRRNPVGRQQAVERMQHLMEQLHG